MDELIQIENLSKVFHTGQGDFTALHDINLTIHRGEIFGIIGLSGAGKSTLVRCINLLERPTSGRVLVDGRELTALPRRALLAERRKMGMIFQGFHLLSQRNALRNVCFPMEIAGEKRAKAEARARQLLAMVGLLDKEKSYPAQLSGGQKQRVAIARALAANPTLLLCDEATSALDPNSTASILELLQKINRELGVTIVIITHEMHVIEKICDRVAVIDKSRIVEMGAVREIFIHPQSAIARELILPGGEEVPAAMSDRCLRVVFDGTSSTEPIIADLILESRAKVNVVYAHTKIIDGCLMGQMVFQLPQDAQAGARIRDFLKSRNLRFSEEDLS